MPTPSPDRPAPRELARKLEAAPAEPGVYLMRDADGRVLYVGKARHLKRRLSAYFRAGGHPDPKVEALVRKIAGFDTIVTRTEKEALILESNLIKRHRPRYNVVLKDDKRYPSLRLDLRDVYPGFSVVRKIGEDDALYFGPFASAHAVRETLKLINKTFKLRKCKASEFSRRTRPCLHCQMNGCLAPCCRDVPADVYREQVQEAVMFLKGRTPELVRKIRSDMEQAAQAQEFEKAARLRDKLFSVQRTIEKQVAVSTDFRDREVFAAAAASGAAVVTQLSVRGGFLTGTRNFPFPETMASETEMLGAFIRQCFDRSPDVPPEILVSHQLEDADLTAEWLAARRGRKVRLQRPERGEKARLVDMAVQNAQAGLKNLLGSRQSDAELMARLQRQIGLGRLPERIECVDNSNLMGTHPVAGIVVFVDGRPEPSAYRKYRIQTVGAPDDYAFMSEILRRRFGKGAESRPFPDLLMLDGGRGQLGIAQRVMDELGLRGAFDVLAIAKRDERRGERLDKIYLPGRVNPVSFGRQGDLLLFLQRVRDEAHRFAIGFHRKQRRISALRSVLDDVPGVGKQRRRTLMSRFKGLDAIRAATLDELSVLPGFNRKIAQAVLSSLAGEGNDGKDVLD